MDGAAARSREAASTWRSQEGGMRRASGWAVAGVALALGVAGCSMFRRDIEIVVRDPAGKAVAGATLSCHAPSLEAPDVQTDRHGKADVPRLAQPVDVCQVQKAGYQRRLPFRVP